jgi:hypothetical protein
MQNVICYSPPSKLTQLLWLAKQDKGPHHEVLIQKGHLHYQLQMEVDLPSFHTLTRQVPTSQQMHHTRVLAVSAAAKQQLQSDCLGRQRKLDPMG